MPLQMGTRKQWNIVFYFTAAVYMFGAVIFEIFGSAERQPWAMIREIRIQDLEMNERPNNRSNNENMFRKKKISKQENSSYISEKLQSSYKFKRGKPIDTQTPEWIIFKRITYVY